MARGNGTIVIALGGNALVRKGKDATFEEQMGNVRKTCDHIAKIVREGYRVVITHGNGPQVGNLLIQQKAGEGEVPSQPMHVCGAMTQGQIGYMIQNALRERIKKTIVTVVTQVVVSERDRAFKNPTKPVGPFYEKKVAPDMIWDAGRGYRRVVPSPDPKKIVEAEAIRKLVEEGVIVIASGGGGIPVVRRGRRLEGVDAVIDKDLAAERLAEVVGADTLLILTAVPCVYLNFNKPGQTPLRKMNVRFAEKYMRMGEFAKGSMEPKIKAAIRFLKRGGRRVIITSPELASKALEGRAGTLITK